MGDCRTLGVAGLTLRDWCAVSARGMITVSAPVTLPTAAPSPGARAQRHDLPLGLPHTGGGSRSSGRNTAQCLLEDDSTVHASVMGWRPAFLSPALPKGTICRRLREGSRRKMHDFCNAFKCSAILPRGLRPVARRGHAVHAEAVVCQRHTPTCAWHLRWSSPLLVLVSRDRNSSG